MTLEDAIHMTVQPYLEVVNATPFLLSLLYDINLMPEQLSTLRDAELFNAIVFAYRCGLGKVAWDEGRA